MLLRKSFIKTQQATMLLQNTGLDNLTSVVIRSMGKEVNIWIFDLDTHFLICFLGFILMDPKNTFMIDGWEKLSIY
jgi:hypothetical protein